MARPATGAAPRHGEPPIAIYDGRQLLGLVYDTLTGAEAVRADGRELGHFATRREAQTAILADRPAGEGRLCRPGA